MLWLVIYPDSETYRDSLVLSVFYAANQGYFYYMCYRTNKTKPNYKPTVEECDATGFHSSNAV